MEGVGVPRYELARQRSKSSTENVLVQAAKTVGFRICDNNWNTTSSANSAIDSSCMVSTTDLDEDSLWNEEIQRKRETLERNLKKRLQSLDSVNPGLALRFSEDVPKRISERIARVASCEPCGLRGCRVHLRLLHEDLASVLMNSMDDEASTYKTRSEKSASWHDIPRNRSWEGSIGKCDLNFRALPTMDGILTGRLSFDDTKTSKGSIHQGQLRKSLFSPAELPALSGASKLRVPCADLGSLDLYDPSSVPTIEVYVYLAPTVTWMWRVKKLFSTTNIKPDAPSNSKSTISVAPDFTLVKRKLYRTRNSTFEVYRCNDTR